MVAADGESATVAAEGEAATVPADGEAATVAAGAPVGIPPELEEQATTTTAIAATVINAIIFFMVPVSLILCGPVPSRVRARPSGRQSIASERTSPVKDDTAG